ncbi:MAG: hybrid sensor histidine kinase/response regulator [Anaerolineae bacterium]|jgi:signal transduction histidine kinase
MDETRGNILVIDDEVGMREGCRRALTPYGYHVDIAEHGVEGLQKLRQGAYDLVLLDAMMPGMSGLELLERILEHDPEIVCVMITGYATVELAAQAMKQGAQDFLPKPFTADELLTVVQRGLAQRQHRLDLRQQQASEEEALQLERTRQEIAKLDAIESRFMLVIVHELRNPAGVIKNYLQLMRAGYVDEDEWDEYLEKLDLRAGQLLNMLDDLLELAQLKQLPTLSKFTPVVVSDILAGVTRRFQPMAETKGLDFVVQTQASPTLLAQPAHLQSLWSNLIDNAIRYTVSGQIEVMLAEDSGELLTTVRDTGIGISTEELARIFQEFYRTESAKAEVELGTGLGLPIVDQIVKIYHGAIHVDSVPGQGTTFTVRLPLAAPDAAV